MTPTRGGPTDSMAPSKRGGSLASEVGSFASEPAMTLVVRAMSAMLRAITQAWSCDQDIANIPWRLIEPYVGL